LEAVENSFGSDIDYAMLVKLDLLFSPRQAGAPYYFKAAIPVRMGTLAYSDTLRAVSD
jgi:hypothetical protein